MKPVSSEETERLAGRLLENAALWQSLERLSALKLPSWYLGAGCVAQTIWNLAHGKAPRSDIFDYDLVYYDPDDVSEEGQQAVQREAERRVAELPIRLDVKNQARVHLWYKERFGYSIEPYASTEDAICTWPTTATAIGVRLRGCDLEVFAPFGLDDLFSLIVRANRVQVTPDIYEKKVARWVSKWPALAVLPWSDGVGSPGKRRCEPP